LVTLKELRVSNRSGFAGFFSLISRKQSPQVPYRQEHRATSSSIANASLRLARSLMFVCFQCSSFRAALHAAKDR
jgi:hypothetical protein